MILVITFQIFQNLSIVLFVGSISNKKKQKGGEIIQSGITRFSSPLFVVSLPFSLNRFMSLSVDSLSVSLDFLLFSSFLPFLRPAFGFWWVRRHPSFFFRRNRRSPSCLFSGRCMYTYILAVCICSCACVCISLCVCILLCFVAPVFQFCIFPAPVFQLCCGGWRVVVTRVLLFFPNWNCF